LVRGQDNCLPPRPLILDVTMTHDRYGRSTLHVYQRKAHLKNTVRKKIIHLDSTTVVCTRIYLIWSSSSLFQWTPLVTYLIRWLFCTFFSCMIIVSPGIWMENCLGNLISFFFFTLSDYLTLRTLSPGLALTKDSNRHSYISLLYKKRLYLVLALSFHNKLEKIPWGFRYRLICRLGLIPLPRFIRSRRPIPLLFSFLHVLTGRWKWIGRVGCQWVGWVSVYYFIFSRIKEHESRGIEMSI
jgi:hypothetical protein